MPFQTQSYVEMAKKREKAEMYIKSPIIVIIKKAIMPSITPSQKTKYSLGNFHSDNY